VNARRVSASRRLSRWMAATGTAGLLLLGGAYWFTHEPAPRVRVLWREGVTAQQQEAIAQCYLLVNGRDRMPGGSEAFDLLDTSVSNVSAIVHDPGIADTNDIDRDTYIIPFETQYGSEWMWVAYRIPGLRETPVRTTLIAALALMAVFGAAVEVAARLKAR
jgi:hypothetical protein